MKRNNTFIPRDNLVAEYLLDGNANDTAGSNNGTATDITRVDGDRGYVNQCASLNGSSSRVSLGNIANLTENWKGVFHIQFSKTNIGSGENLLSKNAINDPSGYTIWINSSGRIFFHRRGSVRKAISTTNSIVVNKEYLLSIVINGNNSKIYLNGVEQALTDNDDMGIGDSTNSHSLTLGSSPSGADFYSGKAALLRIYNKIPTESQINSLYQEGLRKLGPTNLLPSDTTSVKDSLVASYSLNGNVLDSAGSNNGTASNITYSPVWGGEVASFNGSSSRILYSNGLIDSDSTYSIMGFVKINTGCANSATILDFFKTSNTAIIYNSGTQQLEYDIYNLTTDNFLYGDIPLDEYFSFSLVRDKSSGIKLYINGVLEDSNSFTGNAQTLNYTDSIGCRGYVLDNFLSGDISILNFYNRALSQEEITNLYKEGARYIYGNKYSTPNLEKDKVLEISKPAVGGIYYDQSGNGNNGTATNVTDSTEGLNNVMEFNGSSSKVYLGTGNIGIGGDISISFSIDPDDISAEQYLFSDRTGPAGANDRNVLIRIISGYIEVLNGNGSSSQDVTPVSSPITTTKQHFVYTRNGTTKRLYKNGVLVDTYTGGYSGGITGNQKRIGHGDTGIGEIDRFDGNLSNLKVYNRALSSKEVQQDFYSNYIS